MNPSIMSNLERQFQSENLLIQKELAKSKQANNKEKLYINQLQRLNNTERQLLWREAQTQATIEETKELMKFMVSQVKQRRETERMMKMEYKIKANETRRAMGLSDNASIEEPARYTALFNFDGNIKKELAIAKERAEAIFPSDSIHVLLNLHPSAIAKRKKAREDIAEQKSLETKEQVTQWEHITRAINKCLFWLFNK
jgi:hypothetical protein